MRRMLKRITSMVLVIALACGVFGTVPVSAASFKYDTEVVEYLSGPSGKNTATTHSYAEISMKNCPAEPADVKVSSSKVGITAVQYDASTKKARIAVDTIYAGTYTVTFKVNGTQYSSKVTFKKYKNPVKTLKITGVKSNANIASKTDKKFYGSAKLKKNVANAKLTVKPISGWRLKEVTVTRYSAKGTYEAQTFSKKYSAKKTKVISVGALSKDKSYVINLTFKNKKNGAKVYLEYYIN